MVIRLTVGSKISGAIRYNEQKVVQKQAHVLGAMGFANNQLAAQNRNYTTNVLELQSRKNPNVKKPTLHFSLSLHPSEKVSDEKFRAMVNQFMGEMGYENQPYIVYRHHDTAHPHVHVVTTCVDETGSKLNDTFIKRRINDVRQELELQFGLIRAEGRGKGVDHQAAQHRHVPTNQSAGVYDPLRKEQLKVILQQVLQQKAFSTIEEYCQLLKKQQVNTILHRGDRQGKQIKGISYQLTDSGGKALTTRIKASEIGAWATWNGVEKQFIGVEPKLQQSQRLEYGQYRVLAAMLSEQLRTYKKGRSIYYDSALVENFPTDEMQKALHQVTQYKLTKEVVNEAVQRFELYKRSQLPEIIKKEQVAFSRSMEIYTKIASEIEGSSLNKFQFYQALSVTLDPKGHVTSPTNRHLAYQIDPVRWAVIQSETGPDLKIPALYLRGERTVMLFSESNKSFSESYYEVRPKLLEHILKPDKMVKIHRQLNENYLNRLIKDGPVIGIDQVRYFYQRGIIVDPKPTIWPEKSDKQPTHLIRYKEAPAQVAVASNSLFSKQIPHLNMHNWEQGLSTEAGRYMTALAQCIDQAKLSGGKSNEINQLRERIYQRDPALSTYSDEELVTALEMRSQTGKGLIKQTELDVILEPRTYMNENAIQVELLKVRANDVFGYEQTGKYKHVGKGIKKRSRGREL
ncbi:relaxase/mobilization nuclease domain-containing protein (plasmid) [Spirosoma sp. SC4-14]|uniref:relaxase/mobilization nuclease domain-containing protein n=1 Tax=Spirosoma sp. SC4-14 TaxID=3128900 RepID=UPI0030D15413